MALLSSEPRFLKWAGCDLIHTTDSKVTTSHIRTTDLINPHDEEKERT